MAIVLWIIIGVLTVSTGAIAVSAIVAMAGSKYRG
jgi:hypothetical protein